MSPKKITLLDFQKMKVSKEKITMLTAYDYLTAKILDSCGIEVILVGDSLGMVIDGYETTLPVTVEDIIYHTKSVAKGATHSFIVGDMPFMSYQISVEEAKRNACRIIKEGGANAVKLEGGVNVEKIIKAITDIDIPVMGHIGLTPQSIHRMGGYKVQGKNGEEQKKILQDAKAVERAGAFAIVLEGIPAKLAEEITESLKIPTIGIGAGVNCDGQVLVFHDMVGYQKEFKPKFVKRYLELHELIGNAVKNYIEDVKLKRFPTDEHSFHY